MNDMSLPAQPTPGDAPAEPAADARPVRAHIDLVNRINTPPGLLVQGWVSTADAPQAVLDASAGGVRLNAAWTLRYPRPDVAQFLGREAQERFGLIAFYPLPDPLSEPATLALQFDEEGRRYGASRHVVRGIEDGARTTARTIWPQIPDSARRQFDAGLPESLLALLAGPAGDVDDLIRLHVDQCAHLGEGQYVIAGWCLQASPALVRMTLVDETTGLSVPLDTHWTRTDRPDVAELAARLGFDGADSGFVAALDIGATRFGMPPPTLDRSAPLSLYLIAHDGRVARMPLLADPVSGVLDACRTLLSLFRSRSDDACRVLDRQSGPGLRRVLERLQRPARVRSARQFGTAPPAPRATLVTPVYGTLEVLRVQLARLAGDAQLVRDAEVLLIVDGPQLLDETLEMAAELHAVFALPLRVVALAAAVGPARAIVAGAELARAAHLMLWSADVLPIDAGWLAAMLDRLDADAGIGVLGAKLLRPDGTLDGLGLLCTPASRSPVLAQVASFGRGHPDLGTPTAPFDVDAVPAAGLLTRRALFRSISDYASPFLFEYREDDLYCARVRAQGLRVVIDPAIRLYHLDGHARGALQARERWLDDAEWASKVMLYNQWLHASARAALTPADAR